MAPASQEPEPASPTTRTDSESSVESIAQTYKDLIRSRPGPARGLSVPPGYRTGQLNPKLEPGITRTEAKVGKPINTVASTGALLTALPAMVCLGQCIEARQPEPHCEISERAAGGDADEPGEQAAAALEANLTNLENRLDALLAAFEAADGPGKSGDDHANSKDEEPKKDTPSTRDEGSNGQPEEAPSSAAAKKP
ncbi:hypothetical protein CSOJ01_04336 [Colletotrichum sojae]|uniref:Uncharacterized protein n=1 Tax=Colletotrichum sojae TaxID=2175907 RepID=A0A8H6JJU7_9PEZI|nr:hypothetical protein CSOJ01_04336 [Colletotrichum sojae]